MKKIAILLLVLFAKLFFSQTQDLLSLAKGNYLGFNALFDENKNLFGYVALYGYGKSGDKTKKFEYVILDKNLNPVANKEFEGDITAGDYFGYIDFRKKMILYPSNYDYTFVKTRAFFSPRSMEVDLATNTINPKIYYDYDNGTFNEVPQPKTWKEERKENKEEKKEKGFNYESTVFEIKEGGFLALEYNYYGSYTNNNSLIRFDENKKEIWRYKYNTSGDKTTKDVLKILEKDEKYIYCMLNKFVKKEKSANLLILDMQTGKEVSNKPINGLLPETLVNITSYGGYTVLDNDKTFSDKIVMVGRNIEDSRVNGFARLMVDKNNFNVDTKTLLYVPDFKAYLPKVSKDGSVENGYYLRTKDFFFLQDGSVGVLMEKYKPGGQYEAPKTTDLVYLFTDVDFKIKGLQVFEKEKTKWFNNDYLFSQYLNSGKDVVFFYKDLQKDEKTREKNWNLFINTLIDGKFKQEKVQISEKDNFSVTPYIGKEGYILLREYNEKDKFNKIRLERLNY